MTRQLNLGPILAMTSAGIAVAAIIAGFIIVGGPGNARDRRLDDLTSQRIGQVVGAVQCAFQATGIAPIDYPTAAKTRSLPVSPGAPPALCEGGGDTSLTVGQGDKPASPGDITYADTGPTQATICGNYRAARGPEDVAPFYAFTDVYPALMEPHAAGVHCYVLDLVKSPMVGDPVPATPPAEPPPKRVP